VYFVPTIWTRVRAAGTPGGEALVDAIVSGLGAEDAEVDAVMSDNVVLLARSDVIAVDDALASFDDSVNVGEVVASVGEDVAI
jgi:hypothetical protein